MESILAKGKDVAFILRICKETVSGEPVMDEYEELYKTNKDFKDYVDRYMRNKDVTLEEVLSLRQTQLVAEMYLENESDEQLVR